jgi:hypothetical protein
MGNGETPLTGNVKIVIHLAINAQVQPQPVQSVFHRISSLPLLAQQLALLGNLGIHQTEYAKLALPLVQPVQPVLLPAQDVVIRNSLVVLLVLILVLTDFGVIFFKEFIMNVKIILK